MNKMKKLILAIAVALSFVLPAAWAAEVNTKLYKVPEGIVVPSLYREYFIYWSAMETESLCTGYKLFTGEEVPYAIRQQLFDLAYKHSSKDLLPALRRNKIVPEWCFIMSHPDIREAHWKIVSAKTEEEFRKAVREGTDLTHKKRKELRLLGLDEAYYNSYSSFFKEATKLLTKQLEKQL